MSPTSKVIRCKKPRRYVRIDILTTRREIAELELQRQILQEKHEFYESLQTAKARCGMDWRRFSSHVRIRMKQSTQANTQLHKRVNDNNRLIQHIHRLIQRQPANDMPKSAQIGCRLVSMDNEAHVRHVLHACLDIRTKRQLDSIMKQCSEGTTQDLHTIKWHTFNCGDSCVGVEFHESDVLPFSAPSITGAVNDWPSVNPYGFSRHGRGGADQDEDAAQVHEQD